MNKLNWLGLGLIGVAAGTIALANPTSFSSRNQAAQADSSPVEAVQPEQPDSPKRHKITLSLTSMSDLKVKEKDRIQEGDVIADRTSDRQRLEAKKRQLEIARGFAAASQIAQMSLPLTQLAPLPEPNLESEKVALKQAQMELELATKAVDNQSETTFKQDWLNQALEPEKVNKQAALKEKQIKAAIRVEAAIARMSEAKTRYQQEQYQHSIQLAAHQTNLQKQQYELASLASQLQEVEKELGELVAVKSPYSGRVRRVKVLGQTERKIAVEVTLDIRKKGN